MKELEGTAGIVLHIPCIYKTLCGLDFPREVLEWYIPAVNL
jgi:hypothetical protein